MIYSCARMPVQSVLVVVQCSVSKAKGSLRSCDLSAVKRGAGGRLPKFHSFYAVLGILLGLFLSSFFCDQFKFFPALRSSSPVTLPTSFLSFSIPSLWNTQP